MYCFSIGSIDVLKARLIQYMLVRPPFAHNCTAQCTRPRYIFYVLCPPIAIRVSINASSNVSCLLCVRVCFVHNDDVIALSLRLNTLIKGCEDCIVYACVTCGFGWGVIVYVCICEYFFAFSCNLNAYSITT